MGSDRFNPGPLSETARLQLEWKDFAARMMVDANLLLEPEIMIRQDGYDFIRDQIMVGFRAKVLTDSLPPESVTNSVDIEFREPASTWQMWKRNNRGRWYSWKWLDAWLKRWPVQTRVIKKAAHCTISLERLRSYPEAQYRASDFRLGRAVLMHNVGSPIWDIEHLSGYDYGKPSEGE